MARSVLKKVSDLEDYRGSADLSDVLKAAGSDVRLSPDARHIHVILRQPHAGLLTFDKRQRPPIGQNQKKLDVCSQKNVPVVDVLYLGRSALLAVVYESGKVEFWEFHECKAGWNLLQTSDLCNSPRARVVSVCTLSSLIVWCEERPPSESSQSLGGPRSELRYCVCRRDFELQEAAVTLGGVKIALHNNPRLAAISSGECVYLLPVVKAKPPLSISKFFLCWSPQNDSFSVSVTCRSTPLKQDCKESDFKRLMTDCLGYLSALQPPEIYGFSPTPGGGLVLLLSTGWVSLLHRAGTLQRVYKLADHCKFSSHASLRVYEDTLALSTERNLSLIDLHCGRELETIALKGEILLYVNGEESPTPHLLSESGLFAMVRKEPDAPEPKSKINPFLTESMCPSTRLVEAVFEEACKYYQQRSVSSTRLTVDMLKMGGRFQAPISLAAIMRHYLSPGTKQRAGDGFVAGEDKLMHSLEAELKALVSLEEVKGRLVRRTGKEVEAVCESLVGQEVSRLLSSSELDKEALLYINSLFTTFPCEAWRAAQAALLLHYNGDGSLSSRAPSDVWKAVLSPASVSSSLPCTSGEPHYNKSLIDGSTTISNAKSASSTSQAPLPVFELLCLSIFQFQPSWLPKFLELSQEKQGSAGLGLSLATSSWSFSAGRGVEGTENNMPLYRRTLCILSTLGPDKDPNRDLEVELFLVSRRPNAILQAMRILMGKQQWQRVTQVAQRFCKQSPLLNKEIFTTLLSEVAQHRDLDPYLDLLWALCPEDVTVNTVLNLVLKNLPTSETSASSSAPFDDPQHNQLTIGLLKPLLRKILQREMKPSQRYADILQSPLYPPPAPPRQPTKQPGTGVDPSTDVTITDGDGTAIIAEANKQQSPIQSAVKQSQVALHANPV
ncbi:Hermansky-Pudlak syndrome 6 protein-like [Thalassophryne amazonica]|uniref:Hermansky-Pudlak syndrome 6 protein-like n=1 Tax=Thalassophryne amazonica TaxID=390379 RepID=UPI001470C89D|nr:Hermansky-Pudlak syndrome 6 protein-like [Thalassophryne amazonica]